jgi:hypothetical protein
MADVLDDAQASLNGARQLRVLLSEAQALIDSPADAVVFICANPLFNRGFEFRIPRSVWLPLLQARVTAAQAQLASITNAALTIPKVP